MAIHRPSAFAGVTIALAGSILAVPAHGDAPKRDAVSVLPLKVSLDPNLRMGRKSSGLVCAPSGSWYWRDVHANTSRLTERVQAILAERGMTGPASVAREFGDAEPLADLRLRGSVSALSMTGCEPWKPTARLVGGRWIKGKGRVSIVWELYSHTAREVLWSKEIDFQFGYDGAESMAAALETGVSGNAAQLVAGWPQ